METDTAARAAERVPGLVLRPYAGETDLPHILRVKNAEYEADGLRWRESLAELRAQYAHASDMFDPARDMIIGEVDGEVVAHGKVDWVDTTEGLREYRSGGAVHPAWRRRGIGRAVWEANVARLREIAAGHQTDLPRVLGLFTGDKQAGAVALAKAQGYEPVRWFFEMERPGIDRDLPELPPLPDGIEVRPVTREQAWTIWKADVEAFRDHWGGFDDSEANFRRWIESPEYQPELHVVAWEGDEVAAGVINAIYPEENAELGIRRGWLDSVFTRRPWRRRGVAKALIARSLHLLADRGMDTGALGVDADNPTGALGLYESFGFAVVERGTAWRRPLGVAS
jgi:mycothiol synthase